MWLGNGEIEVDDFIGFSDEAARTYCYLLNNEEKAIFREDYVMLYRACLHIAVTGRAAGFSDSRILEEWLKSRATGVPISIQCRHFHFMMARADKSIQVTKIRKCS